MRQLVASLMFFAFLISHSFAGIVGEMQTYFKNSETYSFVVNTEIDNAKVFSGSGVQEARSRCCMAEDVISGGTGTTVPCSADCTLFVEDLKSSFDLKLVSVGQFVAQIAANSGAPPPLRPPIT